MNSISNPLSPKSSLGTEPSDEQIMKLVGGPLTSMSESRPLGQQWDMVCNLVRAAVLALAAPAVPEPIFIDFKQATELLAMFGGAPGQITLTPSSGLMAEHSGPGLYAHMTDYPEEGSIHLGVTDEEAVPDAPAVQAEPSGDVIALAEKCSAEVGRHEGRAVWVKFHSQASLDAFATGIVMSATVKRHKPPAAQSADAVDFLETPDVEDESGINTHYSRELVLQCIDAALQSAAHPEAKEGA